MPIKVNISLNAGGRPKPVATHTFHDKRITIGRDKECTLTLEDAQKHVSRMHAEIEPDKECYWIKVVSKVNPISVNGKKVSYGERVPIVEGDKVSVGLYSLEIMDAELAPEKPAVPDAPPGKPEISEEATLAPAPKAPSVAAAGSESPAARLAALAGAPRSTQAKPADKETEAVEATYVPPAAAPAPTAPVTPSVPTPLPDSAMAEDEVTYIPPMWAKSGNRTSSLGAQTAGTDASEDLTHVGRPQPKLPEATPPTVVEASKSSPSLELDFDLSEAFDEPAPAKPVPATSPPIHRGPTPAAPPPQLAPEVEEGFSEDVTYVRRPPPKPAASAVSPAKPPEPAKPPIPAAADIEEEETHYRPVVQPSGIPAASKSEGVGTDAERAVAAFLEGAGLSGLRVTDAEKFMRDSGVMVRAAVEGVMMLLLAREDARRQMGADTTGGADGNPIKSMTNPDEVIAFLFDPKRPAIADVDPVQAFSDACSDLRAHQVALFEGMRAAIMTALLRLDPKKLEREHASGLGMLNITRKSKLWDLSTALHEQLAHEIEEDFVRVFGAEILAAYNDQVRKTRGG